METLERFRISGDLAIFTPVAEVTLQEGIRLVTRAITHAVQRNSPFLLLDLLGLSGYGMPSLGDRYFMGRTWAEAASGKVILVVVVPAGVIDQEKFGSKVANTMGTVNDVYPTVPEALAWLAAQGCKTASP